MPDCAIYNKQLGEKVILGGTQNKGVNWHFKSVEYFTKLNGQLSENKAPVTQTLTLDVRKMY